MELHDNQLVNLAERRAARRKCSGVSLSTDYSVDDALRSMRTNLHFMAALAEGEASTASAEAIYSMRQSAGLTQQQLADFLNIKQSRVAYLESGKSVQGVTLATLYKVALVCGLSFDIKWSPAAGKNNNPASAPPDNVENFSGPNQPLKKSQR